MKLYAKSAVPGGQTVIECPTCHHLNNDNAKICDKCGRLLVSSITETRKYGDTDYEEGEPKWGSAQPKDVLVLDVLESNERFIFEADQIHEVILGRKDPNTGDAPPVDLSNSQGLEKGVSRRHATIVLRDGTLHIIDNGSANGTFLNGQRLVAQQPRILRDGDDIRLGYLVMRVNFRSAQSPS